MARRIVEPGVLSSTFDRQVDSLNAFCSSQTVSTGERYGLRPFVFFFLHFAYWEYLGFLLSAAAVWRGSAEGVQRAAACAPLLCPPQRRVHLAAVPHRREVRVRAWAGAPRFQDFR